MDEITDLSNRYCTIGDTIKSLQKEREEILTKIRFLKYRVQPGVIVKGKDGKLYRVISLRSLSYHSPTDKPWIKAHPQIADGSFGKRTISIFDDWEVPE